MKRAFHIAMMALVFFVGATATTGDASGGREVLVIQSLSIAPYEAVFEGFQAVVQGPVERILLPDTDPVRLAERMRRRWPGAIFCIGRQALEAVSHFEGVPIVFAMVLEPPEADRESDGHSKRFTGIHMFVEPREQVRVFKRLFPELERMGVLYNPGRTMGAAAATAVESLGMKAVAVPISDPKQGVAALDAMVEKIDAFWMLPDLSVWSPETVEYLFLESLRRRIPVLTFSKKYVDMGAAVAVGIQPRYIGFQAGRIINRLPEEAPQGGAVTVYPDEIAVSVNRAIAEKLGKDSPNWTMKSRPPADHANQVPD